MIDPDAIQARFDALEPFLNERDRRLFAASEARAAGRGGIAAVSRTTGMARSTIGRGLADLRSGAVRCSDRVRRMGGGQKPATETQPGILEALNDLVEPSIRGDPEAPLRWVSKSQRHLSAALAERGFIAGQKLVGRLLKRLNFSLQANCKTREGANHPDRNAQFEHINAEVKAFQASGQPVISVDTKKKSSSETSRMAAVNYGSWGPESSGCVISADGKQRTVSLKNGGEVVERLDNWDDAKRSYTYSILSGPLPVSDYRSTLSVAPDGKGSALHWHGTYQANGRPTQRPRN